MLRLAVPVVVAELGWTAMATVDTLMVGRLSAEAIGAVGLGSAVFLGVSMFGLGLLLGLDTMISQAFGAGDSSECYRSLVHGVYAALGLTLPLSGVIFVVVAFLPGFGINPDVLVLTIPYLKPVAGSLLPLLLYSATRRFLQATGHANAVMIVLVTAESRKRAHQLGARFRPLGVSRARCRRCRLGDPHVAQLYGTRSGRLHHLLRSSWGETALRNASVDRRDAFAQAARPRLAIGASHLSRDGPFRRGDGSRRTIGRGFSRGASDRAVGRGHDLHGAARRVVCGRRSGSGMRSAEAIARE